MQEKYTPQQGAAYEELLRIEQKIEALHQKLPGLRGAAKTVVEKKIRELEGKGCGLAAENVDNPLFAD